MQKACTYGVLAWSTLQRRASEQRHLTRPSPARRHGTSRCRGRHVKPARPSRAPGCPRLCPLHYQGQSIGAAGRLHDAVHQSVPKSLRLDIANSRPYGPAHFRSRWNHEGIENPAQEYGGFAIARRAWPREHIKNKPHMHAYQSYYAHFCHSVNRSKCTTRSNSTDQCNGSAAQQLDQFTRRQLSRTSAAAAVLPAGGPRFPILTMAAAKSAAKAVPLAA